MEGESEGTCTVKSALTKFLKAHELEDHVSDIDEIILSYVISMLEDLGDSDNVEENIDVDQFVEMMDAYLPGFASIDNVAVCEWMFELAAVLSKPQALCGPEESRVPSLESYVGLEACAGDPGVTSQSTHSTHRLDSVGGSERSTSESSTETDEVDEHLETLIEMFPHTVRLELEHCLHGAEGDVDKAVQLVFYREETGMAITDQKMTKQKKATLTNALATKTKDKERLMARYAFIDVDEDKKVFKPPPPKQEGKKLVRYLENQVVSTKGQKFTELKKNDDEEMKKTYISLKPARKYRFH